MVKTTGDKIIVKVAKIVQIFLYWPVHFLLKFFVDYKVYGQENLKELKNLPVIFAANHASYLDSPSFEIIMPRYKGEFYPKSFYPLRFLTDSSFFNWKFHLIAFYVRVNASIKIERKPGRDLSKVLREAINTLNDGVSVVIYPEGRMTRDGKIGKGKRGVAYLHQQTGAPIVPIALIGTYRIVSSKIFLRKNKFVVAIGRPIYSLDKMSLEEGVDKVMSEIKNLYNEFNWEEETDNENNLKLFLKKSQYCDYTHPAIKKIASVFKQKYSNKRKLAVALFYYVRDNNLYRIGFWNRKASETLADKEGCCTSKANLLVALLRASGIPAGYGVMKVKGQEYFGPIVPSFLKGRISKETVHIYTCVYLNNKWIKCDPSDDKKFSENTSYFNPQSKLTDWDGKIDACLNLDQAHILKDRYPLSNIDDIIGKKPKTATKTIVRFGNLYIKFLRENKTKITELSQLESLFKDWVKKNYLGVYYLFFLVSFWQDIKAKLNLTKY